MMAALLAVGIALAGCSAALVGTPRRAASSGMRSTAHAPSHSPAGSPTSTANPAVPITSTRSRATSGTGQSRPSPSVSLPPLQPLPATPAVGSCLSGYLIGLPDLGSQVPCTEPHVYEMVSVFDNAVPLEGASILAAGGYPELDRVAEEHCLQGTYRAAGLDPGLRIGSASALDAWAAPALSGEFELVDAEDDPTGKRAVCALRWDDDTGDALSVASPVPDPLISLWPTDRLPLTLRACVVWPSGGPPVVGDCSQPHRSEMIMSFDATAAMGADWVAGVDPDHPTDRQQQAADRVCAQAVDPLIASASVSRHVRAWASFTAKAWAESTAHAPDYRMTECLVSPLEQNRYMVGTVVGDGSHPARFVPAPSS
jgi:hypothetical protein